MEQIKEISIATAIPTEKIQKNVLDSVKHNLLPINQILTTEQKEGAIALVGGGPSLSKQLKKLQNYDAIIICGSAHDYVMTTGFFRPETKIYCIICDPDAIMSKYLQQWTTRVTYLIASQCDEEVFNLFRDAPKKYIWDCAGGEQFNKDTFKDADRLIIGGCTVGTRAMGMAIAMGYRDLHLFGYDSCLTNKYKHHAYDFYDPEQESLGAIHEIVLDDPVKGKKFICAGYMVAQIIDFQWMLRNFADKIRIKIFGEGALAYLMQKAHEQMIKLKEVNKNGSIN